MYLYFTIDEGTYWGEIPGFQGVWGKAKNLERCREELRVVLEEWIIFRLKNNLELPVIEGIDLNIVEHVAFNKTFNASRN